MRTLERSTRFGSAHVTYSNRNSLHPGLQAANRSETVHNNRACTAQPAAKHTLEPRHSAALCAVSDPALVVTDGLAILSAAVGRDHIKSVTRLRGSLARILKHRGTVATEKTGNENSVASVPLRFRFVRTIIGRDSEKVQSFWINQKLIAALNLATRTSSYVLAIQETFGRRYRRGQEACAGRVPSLSN